MRALIVALVVMIVAVAGGTGALVAIRYAARTPEEPPPAKPTPAAKPTTEKVDEKPTSEPKADAKAEDLPPLPKLSDKSKMTAMNKEKTLYLEVGEDGQKRVLFEATVCLREGVMLEVLVCKKQTKEHESILNVDLDSRLIHAALVAAGAKAGKPVQFVNPKTHEAEYTPASGQKMEVTVHYTLDGKVRQERAQEWILDQGTKKPMAHEWVFAGSRFVKNPDRPNDPDYYMANNGEVIALSNFVDSMLDLPVEISQAEKDLHFKAVEKKIPPAGSKVWVVLRPLADKEKKDDKK